MPLGRDPFSEVDARPIKAQDEVVSKNQNDMFKNIAEAINGLTAVLREVLEQKRDCVTKCDLAEATAEIIRAVGSSIDPEKLRKLSKETDKLEKAVEANQPISGKPPG